jgi:membrane dipeptidase
MPSARPSSPLVVALLADHPLFDAHVDALQRQLDLGHDLGVVGPGQFDLERARAAGLGAVVLVCWCDPGYIAPARGGAFARTKALLEHAHVLARRHPTRVLLAGNGADVERARASGRVACIPGIEGGHSIEESIEKLEWFFARGVRVMTLVWNNHLAWIRSCQDGAGPDVPAGLDAFGRRVVARMNELGILVDLSHAGERSFYDVLECSARPVIASHSGCKALHDHPRNLTDAQLRALAAREGVVGIVFHPGFLDAAAREEEARVRASDAYKALGGGDDTGTFTRQSELMQRTAQPLSIERVLDHLCHAATVAGVDHVGIGSDYDGILRAPQGLEHAGCYANLTEGLLRRGFDSVDVRKILGGNMRRAFARATDSDTLAGRGEVLVPLGAS